MTGAQKEQSVSWWAFLFALSLTASISILYFYNITRWGGYPDFGYGFDTATGINCIALVTEPGVEAGLRVGDRLLSVNGKTFSSLHELRSIRNAKPGSENVYLVARGDMTFTVVISNAAKGFGKAFQRSGYLWMLGAVFIFAGTLVFLMKKHERTSWVFFLFMAVSGLFITFLRVEAALFPKWLEIIHLFVFIFTPAFILHLAFLFPKRQAFIDTYPLAQFVPYLISALIFAGVLPFAQWTMDLPPIFNDGITIYTVMSLVYFWGVCLWLCFKSESEIEKVRARIILLGSALAVSMPLTDDLVYIFSNGHLLPNPSYYIPFYVFFPLSIGYSIVRYNLFEFDAIIKRTYGYLLTTGVVAGVYGLFVLLSNMAFGHLEITKSQAFPLLFVLLVVLFFNPIRNRAQQFIDRTFYRLEYDYQETVQRISESMCSLQNMAQVTKAMMETALGSMFIDSGCLMVLNRAARTYDSRVYVQKEDPNARFAQKDRPAAPEASPQPSLPADEPFLQSIAEKKRIVSRYDLEEDPFFEGQRDAGKQVFDRLGATLLVPIIYENELKGLMALGDKKSGKYYRIEDIKLLNTLANQGAVAIENALLLDDVIEKERMEEELSIARDLQMSMLPAACPRMKGFDIAALCVPAREVGGDFYDFIEMGENSTGIIVGDVTGKGVSGALVMSASRSVFRMLSEQQADVGQIMTRANSRAKQDIREGLFVAILYAVLDGPRRALRLCSAGQTQPVHFRAATGEARFIETKGDSLPIGIVDEVAYEETLLPLAAGDRLVFYTDGIVEAVNEKGEMFGFDRLLAVVRQSGGGHPEAMLAAIKNQVDAFVGTAPQHDDITLIVAGVRG